jgi:hypothetical protein
MVFVDFGSGPIPRRDELAEIPCPVFRAVGSSELPGRFIRGSSEPKRYPVALIFQYPIAEALKQRPEGYLARRQLCRALGRRTYE